MKGNFIFDIDKCVGCNACAVACSIENGYDFIQNWRQVRVFNDNILNELPLLNLSLACNHCEDAPCLKNCPANAYTRDKKTGTIVHHAERCIGCKYCTWACPFDAPQYVKTKGIIEKCTFCRTRLEEDKKPACANLCPTGALDFSKQYSEPEYYPPGFPMNDIKPSIRFIKKKKTSGVTSSYKNNYHKQEAVQHLKQKEEQIPQKIYAKKEWSLIIFTLLVAFIVGEQSASTIIQKQIINPIIILTLGLIAGLLSFMHLGKKTRAWRSMLNLKKSWLSREIFFYSGFMALFVLNNFLLITPIQILNWITITTGFLCLLSIDMVYHLAIKKSKYGLHSAHVFLSGLLFFGIFSQNYIVFIGIAVFKLILYIYRKRYFFTKHQFSKLWWLSASRMDFIISYPLLFWLLGLNNLSYWILVSFILGEIIDRVEYYNELEIITPQKQFYIDLANKNKKTA